MNTLLLNVKLIFIKKSDMTKSVFIGLLSLLLIAASAPSTAQTAPPPSIGENTKGEPAIVEPTIDAESKIADEKTVATPKTQTQDAKLSPLGSATIKESKRESGQVYRIELEHSAGAKQIIEENDSDGSIESTSKDIDDTPNLPKWTLGSW